MLEGWSRITKRIVMAGGRKEGGVPSGPPEGLRGTVKEEADVGGGRGAGACRGGLDRRSDTRRVVVGRRGCAGDAPEWAPRDPGRSRDRDQESRSGPP